MLTTKAQKRTGSLSGILIFFLFFCSNGTACECVGGDARELIDGRDEMFDVRDVAEVATDDLVATDMDRFNCGELFDEGEPLDEGDPGGGSMFFVYQPLSIKEI